MDENSIGDRALNVQRHARTCAECFNIACKGNNIDTANMYHHELQGMIHVLRELDDPVWQLVYNFAIMLEKPMDDMRSQIRERIRDRDTSKKKK